MRNLILYFIILIFCVKKENCKISELPKKLKIGYASWGECDELIYEAVENGLNVVIWFSLDMSSNANYTKPEFKRGPNFYEVAKMIKRFKDNNYAVVNLISIGGWNSPHPDTSFSAEDYYEEWIEFNNKISNESLDFYGFDGIDWDIEGNDNMSSSINHFTFEELDLMGKFSQILKKNGYIVSMAPSESYLDSNTQNFSLSLLFNHPEWEKEHPEFTYHGRNVYSYILGKYSVDTFDFISVQLYEGYSHTLYKYEREKQSFGEILYSLADNYTKGYIVDFTQEENSGINKTIIKIPSEKLVIGLANAWASNQFLFIDENDLIDGYRTLVKRNKDVKGFMFWDIGDEGKNTTKNVPFYMAKVLNRMFSESNWSYYFSMPIYLELLIFLYL